MTRLQAAPRARRTALGATGPRAGRGNRTRGRPEAPAPECQEGNPLPHQALLYRRATLPTRASRPLKDLRTYREECHYEGAAARTPPAGPATGRARTTDINNKHGCPGARGLPAARRPRAPRSARGAHDQGIPPGSRRKRESAGVPPRAPGPEPRARGPPRASSGLRLATTSSTTNPLMADGPHEGAGRGSNCQQSCRGGKRPEREWRVGGRPRACGRAHGGQRGERVRRTPAAAAATRPNNETEEDHLAESSMA